MKSDCNIKRLFVEAVSLFYIILFIYAAVSKIIEFESFEVQLGKSPLLSAFAFWTARLIPITELFIAGLLLFPRFKKLGLYMALNLMVMFSAYIFIILHYSSFVPCSCGGILEKMSWNAHLIFNIVFILLALSAIFCIERNSYDKMGISVLKIIVPIICSIGVVTILFLQSEKIMHYENPFTRRYPNHPVVFKNSYDLKYNSYYFAGESDNKLYLGNYSTPLYLTEFDLGLKNSKRIKVVFNPKDVPFKTVKILVRDSVFYLSDGSIARLYKGSVKDWKIIREYKDVPYFTAYAPITSERLFFRSNDRKTLDNILGIYTSTDSVKIKYRKDLLQKQIDGIFDTDGLLLYSNKLDKSIYLYYYRNEFFIIDKNGNLESRNHTIDTISKVNLKVAYTKNGSVREISSPAEAVNAHAAVRGKLLFVHSQVKGKYENEILWKKSFIIDVYDLEKNTYVMSFPIYKTKGEKLISLQISLNYLYALIGTDLVVYQLQPILEKQL